MQMHTECMLKNAFRVSLSLSLFHDSRIIRWVFFWWVKNKAQEKEREREIFTAFIKRKALCVLQWVERVHYREREETIKMNINYMKKVKSRRKERKNVFIGNELVINWNEANWSEIKVKLWLPSEVAEEQREHLCGNYIAHWHERQKKEIHTSEWETEKVPPTGDDAPSIYTFGYLTFFLLSSLLLHMVMSTEWCRVSRLICKSLSRHLYVGGIISYTANKGEMKRERGNVFWTWSCLPLLARTQLVCMK